MKNRGIKIRIEQPCHEDWNKMKEAEKGRYCQACEKNVVDFSVMSNAQIIDFLSNNNGKVCGRIDKYRLDTFLQKEPNIKSGLFNKYIAGLLMSLGFYHTGLSQKDVISKPNTEYTTGGVAYTNLTNTGRKLIIKGKVIDENTNKALAFARVKIEGSNISVLTDKNGLYTISIPDRYRKSELSLEISYKDYPKVWIQNMNIKQDELYFETYLNNYPKPDIMVMGAVIAE